MLTSITSGSCASASSTARGPSRASSTRCPAISSRARTASRTWESSSTISTWRQRASYTARYGTHSSAERFTPGQCTTCNRIRRASAGWSSGSPANRRPHVGHAPAGRSGLTKQFGCRSRAARCSMRDGPPRSRRRNARSPSADDYAPRFTPPGGDLPAGRDQAAPQRVVAGPHRGVEPEPVHRPAVLLLQQPGYLVVRALDRVHVQHLVGDERRHAAPVALRGLLVQPVARLAPAVRLEHADVRAGRRIEGYLLSHGAL